MRLFLKSLTLISALTATSIVHAGIKPEEFNQYWKDTGITVQEFNSVVNNQRCNENQQNFLGCFAVLDTLVVMAKDIESVQLVTEQQRTAIQGYGEVVKSFGAVSVVKSKVYKSGSVIADYKANEADIKAQVQFRLNLFGKGVVDFTKIIDTYFTAVTSKSPFGVYGTIGILISNYIEKAIDPHASIIPQALFEKESSTSSNSFKGIGTVLRSLQGKIMIVEIIAGGPSVGSGLKAKDFILAVNDKSVEGLNLDEVVDMIRGPEETVTLTILRGKDTLKITVKRGKVETKNVEAKVVNDANKKFGLITLRSFGQKDACKEVANAIMTLIGPGDGVDGFILDLRGNLGGFLDQGICISDLFLPKKKVVVSTKDLKTGSSINFTTEDEIFVQDPLVILINAGSASASEIVSGALQDYGRAVLVGDRSFGKGTAQSRGSLEKFDALKGIDPSRSLKLMFTDSRFYRPSGITNQMRGITPDITVYTKPNPTEDEKFSFREENLLPDALPPEGNVWVQARPQYINEIKSCVTTTGVGRQLFEQREQELVEAIPDYQLLRAQDTLKCVIQISPPKEPTLLEKVTNKVINLLNL